MAHDFEIIGHRGASSMAPENTKSSFLLAFRQNADGVECDIHLTKDRKVIISHDGSTKRTTGVDLEIKDTNSSDLRKLDAGSFKGPRFKGEQLPFLDEIIEVIPPKHKFFIEIKCGSEVIPYLKDIIDKSNKKEGLVIIGFNLDTITAAKNAMPEILVYWLVRPVQDEKNNQYVPYDPELIESAKKAGLDGLNVHYGSLTKKFIDDARQNGQKVYAWTVDDVNVANRCRHIYAAGIATNNPDLMIKTFKTAKSP